MHQSGPEGHHADSLPGRWSVELDSMSPVDRFLEAGDRIAWHRNEIEGLVEAQADALRQLRRERLSLQEIGDRLGLTRQQVHRLLRRDRADDEPTLLYVTDQEARGPAAIGSVVVDGRGEYRVVRAQAMEPLAGTQTVTWAVLGTPTQSQP